MNPFLKIIARINKFHHSSLYYFWSGSPLPSIYVLDYSPPNFGENQGGLFPRSFSHSMLCGPPFFLFSYSLLAETFQSGILLYAKQKIKGDQTLDSGPGLTRGEGWVVFSKSILLLSIGFFVSWPPMHIGFQRVRHKRCPGTAVETWPLLPSTKGNSQVPLLSHLEENY